MRGVAFELYKSAQGRYVRVGTAIAAALVALVVSYYAWGLLSRHLPDDFAYKVCLLPE